LSWSPLAEGMERGRERGRGRGGERGKGEGEGESEEEIRVAEIVVMYRQAPVSIKLHLTRI